MDDFEQSWSYSHPFDYIHGRELEGCIRDHDRLFRQAYQHLKPNGWFEMASISVNVISDDGTHKNAIWLEQSVKYMHESATIFGKELVSVSTWKERFEKAGFVNVRQEVLKVSCVNQKGCHRHRRLIARQLPQSPWPKDPKLKELGRYHQVNMLEAVPIYCYALFTRVLGWKREEIEILLAGVRRDLRDLSNHIYTEVYMIYGQKPE